MDNTFNDLESNIHNMNYDINYDVYEKSYTIDKGEYKNQKKITNKSQQKLENKPTGEYCYRSYTNTCLKDDWNIRNGRCPDYALNWSDEFNQRHWPFGHDYINGYKNTPKRDEFNPKKFESELVYLHQKFKLDTELEIV